MLRDDRNKSVRGSGEWLLNKVREAEPEIEYSVNVIYNTDESTNFSLAESLLKIVYRKSFLFAAVRPKKYV